MSSQGTYAVEFRPGLIMRAWRALGFRYSAYVERPEDEGAHYAVHRAITHWDRRDRLRILLSGKTELELCVETEAPEKFKGIRSHAVVLAPDARS